MYASIKAVCTLYQYDHPLLVLCCCLNNLGITTIIGGGTGPAHGTCATTCTPAPLQMRLMLQATDDLPLNIGFTGKVLFFV